jgi:hypothetical protein
MGCSGWAAVDVVCGRGRQKGDGRVDARLGGPRQRTKNVGALATAGSSAYDKPHSRYQRTDHQALHSPK